MAVHFGFLTTEDFWQPIQWAPDIAGPMTMRDPQGRPCDRVVRVHIREVQSGGFDVLGAVRFAQTLYGRYGMFIHVASMQALHLDPSTRSYFETQETHCIDGVRSSKRSMMYARFGVQDMASIMVFLVNDISFPPPLLGMIAGCAAHEPNEPAVYLASVARAYDLAHELGHVLLASAYDHSLVASNIMLDGRYETASLANRELSPSQVANMRRSPYALPC